MGNPVPVQSRAVDPFASYDSSEVNQLSRLITAGKDVILHSTPMIFNIIGNTLLSLQPGCIVVKDDVTISLEGLNIDFADSDFYVNDSLGHWSEDGNYYVVLEYVYTKSKPAPEASIKIILPSQRNNPAIFNSVAHMLLKVVNVITETGTRKIHDIYDYDPDNVNNFVPKTSDGTTNITVDDYTLTCDDKLLILSGTNNKTIRLLSCRLCNDLSIINLNDSVITIIPVIGETIEGFTNYEFKVKNLYLNLLSNKSNMWVISSDQTISEPVFYSQDTIFVTLNDELIVSEYTGSTDVYLPLSNDAVKYITIVNKSGNPISISPMPASGDVLNGSTTPVSLNNQYDSITLIPYNGGYIYHIDGETAGGIDSNELKVSSNDTTPAFLENKLVAGANITLNVLNDGANEQIQIVGAAGGAATSQVKVSTTDSTEEYLEDKIVAGANITITKGNNAGVEYLSISSSAGSGTSLNLTNISNNYTALISDTYIIANATANININLYSASVCVQELKIINLSPNNSIVFINRNGTDTIEGASQVSLINKYDSISLVSNKVDTWLEI